MRSLSVLAFVLAVAAAAERVAAGGHDRTQCSAAGGRIRVSHHHLDHENGLLYHACRWKPEMRRCTCELNASLETLAAARKLRLHPPTPVPTPEAPVQLSWSQQASKHCNANILDLRTNCIHGYGCDHGTFTSLEQAQLSCELQGDACAGVYDKGCGGNTFYLCKAGAVFEHSAASCVYTSAPKVPDTATAAPALPACAQGLHRPTPDTQCVACPAGKFVRASSQYSWYRFCVSCPRGKFRALDECKAVTAAPTPVPLTTAPTPAPVAKPLACAAGHFVDGEVCRECRPGSYAPAHGRHTRCARCPTGKFQHYAGASSCAVCAHGKYAMEIYGRFGGDNTYGGKVFCFGCPQGKFKLSDQHGQGERVCKSCPRGKFSPKNAAECSTCATGYKSFAGSGSCFTDAPTRAPTPAPPTRAPTPRPTTRAPTPQPTNAPTPQPTPYPTPSPTPANCPPGKFLHQANRRCYRCPRGRVTTVVDQLECAYCARGRFQIEEGETSCALCPAGKFQKFAADPVFCYSCPAGKFQAQEGTVTCDACAWGTSQPRVGQTECLAVGGVTKKNPALAPFSIVQKAYETQKATSEAVENAALRKELASLKGEVSGLKDELADAQASAAVPLKDDLPQSVRV